MNFVATGHGKQYMTLLYCRQNQFIYWLIILQCSYFKGVSFTKWKMINSTRVLLFVTGALANELQE
jgi:hypothetical protein